MTTLQFDPKRWAEGFEDGKILRSDINSIAVRMTAVEKILLPVLAKSGTRIFSDADVRQQFVLTMESRHADRVAASANV